MAGDWIKMRVGLTTHPRVMRIAECLLEGAAFLEWSGFGYGIPGYPPSSKESQRAERHAALRVTRYVTVTALLRFWGYANEHVKGEYIAGIFPEDVDEIAGVPGFADAIEAAGWVEFDPDGGLSMPNFGEHNTAAGERSSGAERQKRYREKAKEAPLPVTPESDVTRDVTVTHREEKSREEKKEQKKERPSPKTKAAKREELTFADWTASLGDQDAIPETDPVFAYAEKVGMPGEFVALAWAWFDTTYGVGGDRQTKTYADWRAVFRKAVAGGWPKYWGINRQGEYYLTTEGEQARRAQA